MRLSSVTVHRRVNRVHIPGSQSDRRWKHSSCNQDKDQEGKGSILNNIWKTKNIRKKRRIFKSNVLSILLYAAESCKVTKGICHMLEIFQNHAPLTNSAFLLAKQNIQCGAPRANWDVANLVREEKMAWIGNVNRMAPTSIPRVAMRWTPTENRRKDDQNRRGWGPWSEKWRLSGGVGARSQSWQRTEHDGVPRCRPYVRPCTKRTK